VVEIAIFWRRDPFSSPFFDGNRSFLATSPFLVVILWWKSLFFSDETLSRRHFMAAETIF
jgi:hypothetical protein